MHTLGAYRDKAAAISPEIIALRRAIHAEPEIGLHTPLTTAKARAALDGLPLEIVEGRATTGFVAVLRGGRGPGRTVLLRGDMDALPMSEDTGLAFTSTVPNAMHACGHDGHVAMLVGAVKLLAAQRDNLRGTVQFMFQPGEEGWHGARFMLDDGQIDPLPDAAFALHLMPNAPHGVFGGRAGPLLASADVLDVKVIGRGGHASMPHHTIDPVPIACEIVTAIQTLVTRRFPVTDPVVVTIAKIEAGTTDNVIPETASLLGTIRTLSPAHRTQVHAALTQLAQGIAAAHSARATVEIEQGFPVTLCDARAVAFGQSVVTDVFGAEAWQTMAAPVMGAEDFSYVLEKVPGAMFFLGASPAGSEWTQCCGLHSNRMIVDETVLARGAALHAALAERFLSEGFV